MYPTNFVCHKCDLRGSTSRLRGKFYYKNNQGKIAEITVGIAICYDCNDIVPVEILPKRNFKKRSKEFNEYIASLGDNNYVNHLFEKQREKREKILESRKSPARCLHCGSHDFDLITDYHSNAYRSKMKIPWRTGVIHRGCGGKIYAKESTYRFNFGDKISERYYTDEGVRIGG